jgi:hypothetical protein
MLEDVGMRYEEQAIDSGEWPTLKSNSSVGGPFQVLPILIWEVSLSNINSQSIISFFHQFIICHWIV